MTGEQSASTDDANEESPDSDRIGGGIAGAAGGEGGNEDGSAGGEIAGGAAGQLEGDLRDRFDAMDQDSDSQLSRSEASVSGAFTSGFSSADSDGNGVVTEGEFAAFYTDSSDSMERGSDDSEDSSDR